MLRDIWVLCTVLCEENTSARLRANDKQTDFELLEPFDCLQSVSGIDNLFNVNLFLDVEVFHYNATGLNKSVYWYHYWKKTQRNFHCSQIGCESEIRISQNIFQCSDAEFILCADVTCKILRLVRPVGRCLISYQTQTIRKNSNTKKRFKVKYTTRIGKQTSMNIK